MIKIAPDTFVQKLHQGDPLAFEQLYQCYHRTLLNVIQRVVADPVVAQDILQDTFLKIWLHLAAYNPERAGLYTWMKTLARRTAIDYIRTGHLPLVSLEPGNFPLEPCDLPLTNAIGINQLVSQFLSPEQWQLIELFYWQGYTHEEIADRLTLPLGTVKTRIRKSLLLLRSLFDEEDWWSAQ